MKILFHLKNGHKFEAHGCSGEDVIRLASQFNNGHLMRVNSYFINLHDAVKPFNDIHDLKNIIDQILDVEGML